MIYQLIPTTNRNKLVLSYTHYGYQCNLISFTNYKSYTPYKYLYILQNSIYFNLWCLVIKLISRDNKIN